MERVGNIIGRHFHLRRPGPIGVTESAEANGLIGAECGAIFIDNALMFDWLRRKLTPQEYDLIFKDGSHERTRVPVSPLGIRTTYSDHERRLLENWEGIKFIFGQDDNVDEYLLALPNVAIHDDPRRGIRSGTIKMTR